MRGDVLSAVVPEQVALVQVRGEVVQTHAAARGEVRGIGLGVTLSVSGELRERVALLVDQALDGVVGAVVGGRLAVGKQHDVILLARAADRRGVLLAGECAAHAAGAVDRTPARVILVRLVQGLGQRRVAAVGQRVDRIDERAARRRDVGDLVSNESALAAAEAHQAHVHAVDRIDEIDGDLLHYLDTRRRAGRAVQPVEVVAVVDRVLPPGAAPAVPAEIAP